MSSLIFSLLFAFAGGILFSLCLRDIFSKDYKALVGDLIMFICNMGMCIIDILLYLK